MPRTLEQLIKDAPHSIFPPASRQRAHALAQLLDGAGYADGGRCYLDGPALHRALKGALSPAAIGQILSYAGHDDRLHVIDTGHQQPPGGRVPFPELARLTGPAGEPAGDLGLTPASSLQEVERAIRDKLPGLPADVFDRDLISGLRPYFEPAAAGETATPGGADAPGGAGTPGEADTPGEAAAPGEQYGARYNSWFDCMLSNGVTGASLTLIGIVFGIGVLAELASGGALTPGLIWLFIVCFGTGAAAILSAINVCMYWYKYP